MNIATGGTTIWTNPAGLFNNVVIVAADGVLYGKAELGENGEAPADLAKSGKLKAIPASSITAVRLNKRNTDLIVKFKNGKNKGEKQLELRDEQEQRDCFSAIHKALAPDAKVSEVEKGALGGAVGPGIALMIFAGLTALGVMAAQAIAEGEEAEITGRHRAIKRLFVWLADTLGTTGILIVGGIFILGALIALVNGMKNPPRYDELKLPS